MPYKNISNLIENLKNEKKFLLAESKKSDDENISSFDHDTFVNNIKKLNQIASLKNKQKIYAIQHLTSQIKSEFKETDISSEELRYFIEDFKQNFRDESKEENFENAIIKILNNKNISHLSNTNFEFLIPTGNLSVSSEISAPINAQFFSSPGPVQTSVFSSAGGHLVEKLFIKKEKVHKIFHEIFSFFLNKYEELKILTTPKEIIKKVISETSEFAVRNKIFKIITSDGKFIKVEKSVKKDSSSDVLKKLFWLKNFKGLSSGDFFKVKKIGQEVKISVFGKEDGNLVLRKAKTGKDLETIFKIPVTNFKLARLLNGKIIDVDGDEFFEEIELVPGQDFVKGVLIGYSNEAQQINENDEIETTIGSKSTILDTDEKIRNSIVVNQIAGKHFNFQLKTPSEDIVKDFIERDFSLFEIKTNTSSRSIKINLKNPFLGFKEKIEDEFTSPVHVFTLIAAKILLKESSFVYYLSYLKQLEIYMQNFNSVVTEKTYTKNTDTDFIKQNASLVFKSGLPEKRVVEFVNNLLNSEKNGVAKDKILGILFDTSMPEMKSLHIQTKKGMGSLDTEIVSQHKDEMETLEKNCLRFFDQKSNGLGRGEYLLIALLLGVDIPLTLRANLHESLIQHPDKTNPKNSVKYDIVKNLIAKLLLFSGGLRSGDIDFRTHVLPDTCPTREILKDKFFEVKEIKDAGSSMRVGSEGIRTLSSDIHKFYQKTNAIKDLLSEKIHKNGEGKKLFAELIEVITNRSGNKFYSMTSNRSGLNNIFSKFGHNKTIDQAQQEISDFLLTFYDTSLSQIIGDEFSDSLSHGQIFNFDAGDFNIQKLILIYCSYLSIMEALKLIIRKHSIITGDEELFEETNLFISFDESDVHKIPSKFKLLKGETFNKNISYNLELGLENILDILHDNDNHEHIHKIANSQTKNDSYILLDMAVRLRNKLKNINLDSVFSDLSGVFQIHEKFADVEKSFGKSDGVFIIKGDEGDSGMHSDIRVLFVKKENLNKTLDFNSVTQHRPSYRTTSIGIEMSPSDFFREASLLSTIKVG